MIAELILNEYENKYATINQIVDTVFAKKQQLSRNTIIWNVNELIKQGKAIRIGRGIYEFRYKPVFNMTLSESTETACDLIRTNFKYLKATVTDTSSLSQFMNLQPFVTTIVIEVRKKSIEAVLSTFRRSNLDAILKKDFGTYEKYIKTVTPIVVRSEFSANPTLSEVNGIRTASLEKMLVDLVCDNSIYGQYQGEELVNIFIGSTELYRVNYSQLLKYAALRKKKDEVTLYLSECGEYRKIRELL